MLSPGQIPEAGVQIALAPDMSDGNLGDEIGAVLDNQIRANRSRPGRVSERRAEKTDILANIYGISASRIKKIIFEEPTRH